ncbi:MAG: serine hydrolase [Candidatus Melainabacteria bacterium]|nr:serine hydrolase [Candidatus Melainabacteria bacterium]
MPPGTTTSKRDQRDHVDVDTIPEEVVSRVKATVLSGAGFGAPNNKTASGGKKNDAPYKVLGFTFPSFAPKKKKKAKYKPTPPGQRLVKAVLITGVLCLAQSLFHHTGTLMDPTVGHPYEVPLTPPFKLTSELTGLSNQLTSLNKFKTIQPGVFAVNLETGQYVDSGGKQAFSAASMIKVPILVSFLMAVERGECKMEDVLEIRPDLIAGGSGFLQWRPPGTKISARKAAQLMMMVSDNTATNLLIDLLGGNEHLNKDFHRYGLQQTKVNHLLADLEGTNTTCPYDLVYLLGRVDNGELVTKEHREFMYEIMGKCKNRSLLPPGLAPGSTIIHKTGTIGAMVGDAGIVTTSGGTRYAVSIQCSRNRNDSRASELIRQMSKMIYGTYALQPPLVKLKPAGKAPVKPADAETTRLFESAHAKDSGK